MRQDFWNGKVALVTGGSSGIGLAAAKLLAERGAHVWLAARRPEALESALEEVKCACQSSEQICGVVVADVSDAAQAAQAVRQVAQAAGVPDIVINSAGVVHPGYFHELDIEKFHWMMDINYFGIVHITKAVVPGMMARRSGYIVNVSSGASLAGVFGYSAYSPTKYAINGFSGVLRSELKQYGIQISLALPPDTDTPQLAYENQFKPPETRALAGNVKSMTAEAVATAILRGVERGHFIILPNTDIWLTYQISRLMGSWFYNLMDWIIARSSSARSKSARSRSG